jgi:hAT family C-terminal dimerisation region
MSTNLSDLDQSFDSLSITSSETSNRTISVYATHCLGDPWGPDGDRRFRCRYCDPPYSTTVHTNFKNHLRKSHQITVFPKETRTIERARAQLTRIYTGASSQIAAEIDQKILEEFLQQDVIDEALIRLLTVRRLPLRLLEWPEFHAFCQTLNPYASSYLNQSHSALPKKIEKSFERAKVIVRSQLELLETRVHISLDIWTSPNRYLFIGICAHYVNRTKETSQRALLGLRQIGGHTAQEQFDVLKPVLEEYGILESLGSIIGDNASSNDKLCRTISTYLSKSCHIQWDHQHQRIRCIGHILNLIVQAFLFHDCLSVEALESYDTDDLVQAEGLDQLSSEATSTDKEEEKAQANKAKQASFRTIGPLGKLHNIVVHIRSSGSRTQQFKGLAGRTIPLDNRTRWNSWSTMLSVALEKESSLDTYVKAWATDLQDDALSLQDWQDLRTMEKNLRIFHEATLINEGFKASIAGVLPTMVILQVILREKTYSTSYDKPKSRGKKTKGVIESNSRDAWERALTLFNKYFLLLEVSPLYLLAAILSPTRRVRWLKEAWVESSKVDKKIKICKDYWVTWNSNFKGTASYEKTKSTEPEELSEFKIVSRQFDWYHRRPQSQDEFDDFLTQPSYDIGTFSSLQWWNLPAQRERFPKLSVLAYELLSIPAMSDEPERIFSAARRTISWERSQLGPALIEQSECMKHWIQQDLI